MEGGKILRNSQIIILGVCVAVATIISSIIFSKGFLKVMQFTREVITVTGSAQEEITSDFIVWNGSFSRREVDLATAYKRLKEDLEKVKSYLISKGVSENELIASQISTETIYKKNERGNDTNEIEGYYLKQDIQIQSNNVYEIEQLSRESTELIDQEIQFESQEPEYFYTKLEELKIEMLARATENARQRAENMARATGNKTGFMRSAKMGVFQITPVNSTEVSDWGVNDTSSLRKKVTSVVTVSFAIE
ncbi:MAG TPA: SIMPL domain-containing protein [Candidatus Brocadiia bacterium]|nr:SIMPL domain-containing protein [Candidatus Brocadiales bacterium]